MRTENDLIQKLMISKKIMDKHKEIPRGNVSESDISTLSAPELQSFDTPASSYNIPSEFLSEQEVSRPVNTNPGPITEEKIKNSLENIVNKKIASKLLN